jgi:predicted nucleic acid-binding protein
VILCDTSTIAKFYVFELESAAVRTRLDAEDTVCISELVRVELMGVFHRRLRDGKWSRDEFLYAAGQFAADDIRGYWTWMPLDSTIVEAAAKTLTTLPTSVFLRASDCIHLVTAIHHNFAAIFTHDRHQTVAAATLGLEPVAIPA